MGCSVGSCGAVVLGSLVGAAPVARDCRELGGGGVGGVRRRGAVVIEQTLKERGRV